MFNAAFTRKKLDDLASQVESRDPETAAHMRDLADAVVGGPTADTWAYSNIRSVLDPDRISDALVGDSSTDLWTRGLEFLRNSLVLLPLAITWFGIALAVDAYYKSIAAQPELAGQSFIYLWQGGFGGRMPLPLGTLAVLDAVLLAGVFVLTLLAYARSAWLGMVGWRFGAGFGRELNAALAEAELALAPRRGAQYHMSLETLEQNARDLLHEIADERGRVAKMAQQREQELGDLNGITDNLKDSAVVFLNASQSLANTHTATLAALNGVTGSVKGLAAAQQEVMKAVQNVAGRLEGLGPQRPPESFSSAVARMEASEALAQSAKAGQPYGVVNLMLEQQRALQEALRKIDGLIAAQQDSMEKLILEQRHASRGTAGPTGGMGARPPEPPVAPPPENIRINRPRPPEAPRKPQETT